MRPVTGLFNIFLEVLDKHVRKVTMAGQEITNFMSTDDIDGHQKIPRAAEMRRFRRLLSISYTEQMTDGEVRRSIRQHQLDKYKDLLSTGVRQKLKFLRHTVKSKELAKIIAQRTVTVKKKRGDYKRNE
ncbi:hypothetical protein ElyMa_003513700 [Elysia marginata]|uniref:Uncharacterized protein n=1 Tax=Elysia marginata TaxID=1093978 RepID=A0AAV4EF96_9GAST|nr:hypothetical protein ElyMa_003513700 [Elysia marginata]